MKSSSWTLLNVKSRTKKKNVGKKKHKNSKKCICAAFERFYIIIVVQMEKSLKN